MWRKMMVAAGLSLAAWLTVPYAQAAHAAKPVLDIDFVSAMAGVPKGVELRQNAEVMVYGLRPKNVSERTLAGGCTIGKFTFPGAFELKATVMVDAEPFVDKKGDTIKAFGVLWDDKYIQDGKPGQHCGLQLGFSMTGTMWTPALHVGLGKASHGVNGPTVNVTPGDTLTLVVRYFGDRTIEWDFGGTKLKSSLPESGVVAAGKYPVTIGDRVGQIQQPFRGAVQRVTVTELVRQPLALSLVGRAAFERGEKDAKVCLAIENLAGRAVRHLQLTLEQTGVDARPVGRARQVVVDALAIGDVTTVEIPVETRLRPGWQGLRVTAKDADGLTAEKTLDIGIGPRFADRMTALMWQGGRAEDVRGLGLTHEMVRFGLVKTFAEGASAAAGLARLDAALVAGMKFADGAGVIYYPPGDKPEKYYRQHRDGTFGANTCGHRPPVEVNRPELLARAQAVHADNARAFKDHPAFAGVLNCSEWREWSFPSFNADHLRYRRETGRDVPADVVFSRFGREAANRRYPDGIVPEDDEVLAFYRWFWSGGDGWAAYFKACSEPYRQIVKHPFFSWWDPAVRCPPRWGSGRGTDVLSQWVYAYPEPINVAGPCEDLLAMAEGSGQDVMIMTQAITYRAQIAPKNEKVVPLPAWVKRRPNANFPSIPPDSLQEATWAMISKPVKGIMYHGYGCLMETGEPAGYVYTNPKTTEMMRNLQFGVVQPLGPMLKKLGRAKSPVAVLESFTSVINGMPWNDGYAQQSVTFLQRARLDPHVVYEETLERDGFAGIKVLFVPTCRFVTPKMIRLLKQFRASGGILIGDTLLNPAIQADLTIPVVERKLAPAADLPEEVEAFERENRTLLCEGPQKFTRQQKVDSQARADELRRMLAARYEPTADSSDTELFTFARRWGSTDYLFVINDKRTFGDYVGPWGRTMEEGLPHEGWASLRDPSGKIGAVYELSRGGEVTFERVGDRVRVPLAYETNDGRLLVFLPEKIRELKIACSESVEPGGIIKAGMKILGASGKPLPALLPVEIRAYDAAGHELDGAGFLAAEDGDARIAIRTNLNDASGAYRVVFRDRASGLTSERWVK